MIMKRFMLFVVTLLMATTMSAKDLTGIRFYVNPGHGSFGPNDRPMATIPYPNLPTTKMPDTLGFYESNTNLWKCMYLGEKLEAMGATVLYSRTQNGPWPYEMKNGDYPDYRWNKGAGIADPTLGWQLTDSYDAHPDYEKYNRNLSEISREVEENNIDYFISVHSNALEDGTTTNYAVYLFRGPTNYSSANSVDGADYVEGSYEKAKACNVESLKAMEAGIEVASRKVIDVRGDWTFYGSHGSLTHNNGKTYNGYLGVLRHGASGFLVEGYFHTYQPSRHRALNQDWCHMEGLNYYRGIVDYYGADKETTGYIVGTVKDQYNKMSHSLYQYAPRTNDQWVPCNGAEVILKKAGVEIARYNVDTMYNGIFVFKGLEPGDDYTLDATCPGYHPLAQDQKVALTVKANETTYPMIYLVDTAYVPPTSVYTNYPNPGQPSYLGVPSTFEMKQDFVDKTMDELFAGKTIRRVLYRNGMMYVLAIDEAKEPTLAVVNDYGVVEAELPTDFCSVVSGDGMKLSDITFTAEGVLVGCNMEAVSYTPSNKWNLYKWEKTAEGWKGELWISHANNETAGNYSNAMIGTTFAYSGTLTEGTIAAVVYTTGSSTHGVRFSIYNIADNTFAGALRNQPNGVTLADYGHKVQMVVSPRDSMSFILSSPNKPAFEWQIVNSTKSAPTIQGTMTFKTHTPNYFKYAGKAMMAAPAEDAEGKNIGVALYDITDGVDKAQLIKTTNTTLEASEALYTAAFAQVKSTDLTLYLIADDAISRFTTTGVDQPVIPAISAYDLNVTLENDIYTFTYNANSDAKTAALVFYKDGVEAGRVVVDVKKGANTYVLPANMLPGEEGDIFTWALDLTGEAIANWGRVHHTPLTDLKADASTSMVRPFVSINNNPESDYFQHLYVMDRQGGSNAKSGLHTFTPDYKQINTAPLKGGRAMYGSPYRTYVDDQGYIWISDGRDGTSGIVVADPANLEGTYEEFFDFDTRNSAGLLTKNGVDVGSSSVGLSIYGTGKDAKLLTVNEDPGSWLKAFSLVIYNIGTEEGTYKHTWGELPSSQFEIQGINAQADGYPLPCSHGVWIASRRTAGNNNASATALQFYDWEGTRQLSSAEAPYKDFIDGCASGACALTEDESVLYMIDGSKNLLVWDIVWEGNKPVMTLRYSYNCGMSSIREMHLDYAGNLVCSGDEGTGLVVFAIPSAENNTLIPAKKSLTLTKVKGVAVTSMELSTEEVSVELDATLDLSGLVVFTPADATNKLVTWKSENESVATVSATGVVTGLKLGTTKISATSMEGNYSDTLVLTVAPISVKGIEILSGTNGTMTIGLGSPYAISYKIIPANAANQNVNWESSDSEIVAVQNNQALVIGMKEGSALLTATTEDGGHQASLTIVVGVPGSVEDILSNDYLNLNAPMYDILGRQVDNTYRGIVIQNGNKYLLK